LQILRAIGSGKAAVYWQYSFHTTSGDQQVVLLCTVLVTVSADVVVVKTALK